MIYLKAAGIGVGITALTYLVGLALGWFPDGVNWFEVAASTANYAATYLSIKQRRAFYLIGIGASLAYAVVYGSAGLLASAVLSAYLTLTLLYGFFRWGKDKTTRPVHNLEARWILVYISVTAFIWAGAFALVHLFGGNFAPWDAALLALTILAQLMLDQKVIQTWIVWTAVNVIGVVLYYQSGLYFAAVQQLVFGIANLWGFLAWRKTMKNDEPVNTLTPIRYGGSR